LADFLVLGILRETQGRAVAVSNEEALAVVEEVMQADGLFICPEAATAVAALKRLVQEGAVDGEQRVVVINTGSGLKYASLFAPPVTRVPDDAREI
jgi:threonine synthase